MRIPRTRKYISSVRYFKRGQRSFLDSSILYNVYIKDAAYTAAVPNAAKVIFWALLS